jgi:ABC-type oligopeptide transport system substrate-binding subunit
LPRAPGDGNGISQLRKRLKFHDGIDRPVIAKTALLGQAQPLWSLVPPGSRGQIDFGEQFPYDSEEARTLLKEAGDDFQRYVVQNMMLTSVSSYGHLQGGAQLREGLSESARL